MVKYDKSLYVAIGNQLRDAREKKNMSLQDVSDAIGGKKTKQTIMRYEAGKSRVEAETMKDLCRVLGLNVNDVVSTARLSSAFDDNRIYNLTATSSASTDELCNVIEGHGLEYFEQARVARAYANADAKTKKIIRQILDIE